eukprot:TRINITY_DN55985_c0_g1_i1.p1 TRINITY_DN55985_c0_g1~~TRINITY_DN55985_c0_g1_i1.p1  ORF type:complete len:203 (-),score=40.19 TRINITY_DN55985_c0_g1_i1:110-640(-)
MPKVVTFRRMPVFTNARQKLVDDTFNVFHCKRCNTHVVITDVDLQTLPRRNTDGALILDARKAIVQPNTAVQDEAQLIRRPKGVERQYVHACSSCGKEVGYTSTPPDADLKLLYLSETAVSVPWHRMKTPHVCKVCGYVCQSEAHLEAHKKQRQHYGEESDEAARALEDTKPIIVG